MRSYDGCTHYCYVGATIFGLILMVADTICIVFLGRRSRIGDSRLPAAWQPKESGLLRLNQGGAPRVFSMQLYFAHVNGASIQKLSRELKLPEDWVEESVEAARMCVEFELPVRPADRR